MKILTTRSQLRYTLETAHRVIFEPGVIIGSALPPPAITLLSPNTGPIGTSVSVSGSGFTGASSVTFGGVSATFSIVSDAAVTATAPSGTGIVDVVIVTIRGSSATGANSKFTYVPSLDFSQPEDSQYIGTILL